MKLYSRSSRLPHLVRSSRLIPLLIAAAGIPLLAQAASLSFDDAVALAGGDSPQWAASQAKVEALRQSTVPAGELPDPKLALGVENFPVGGPDRYSLSRDFMTMERVAIMQDIPNREKREARVALAQARVLRGEAEQRLGALTARREAAAAWIRRYFVERQLARIDDLLEENKRFDAAVRAQLASGRSVLGDIVLPRQEAALLATRQDALVAQRTQAIAALERWIGAAAREPLQGIPRQWVPKKELPADALHGHPELQAIDAARGVLDAEVREARAMKKSDWGVELAYQRRAAQFGDMVSMQFTFDLPLFAGRRQDPRIAAKLSERVGLDAEREALRREHLQVLANDRADFDRVDRALERNRGTMQSLAREKVALTLASYRAGKTSLTEVIAARRELVEARLEEIVLEGERAGIAARLHYTSEEATSASGDAR